MSRQEENSPEFRCNWRERSYATNAGRIPGKKQRARIPGNARPLLCKHRAAYAFEHPTMGPGWILRPAATGQLGGVADDGGQSHFTLAKPGFRWRFNQVRGVRFAAGCWVLPVRRRAPARHHLLFRSVFCGCPADHTVPLRLKLLTLRSSGPCGTGILRRRSCVAYSLTKIPGTLPWREETPPSAP